MQGYLNILTVLTADNPYVSTVLPLVVLSYTTKRNQRLVNLFHCSILSRRLSTNCKMQFERKEESHYTENIIRYIID